MTTYQRPTPLSVLRDAGFDQCVTVALSVCGLAVVVIAAGVVFGLVGW